MHDLTAMGGRDEVALSVASGQHVRLWRESPVAKGL